jgi:hypothetical protein
VRLGIWGYLYFLDFDTGRFDFGDYAIAVSFLGHGVNVYKVNDPVSGYRRNVRKAGQK